MVTACVRCNVKKGNRTPKEAGMVLYLLPRKPYSGLYFEVTKYLKNGGNQEWRKYVIGMEPSA
jgi:5-methylcytosine-specific restriction endonuclease McrA